MAWQDNIKEAAYTSPTGTRFVFEYENVSVESDKKTATFIFPERDGAFIQDLGRAGRRFPFTVFFSGETYDETANSFLEALEERGAGKLEHPLYGDRTVVPTGTIKRADNLVTAANQAVFTVSFSETIEDITFPESTENLDEAVLGAASDFEDAGAEEFSLSLLLREATDVATSQNKLAKGLQAVDDALSTVARTQEQVNTAFETVKDTYSDAIENIADSVLDVGKNGIRFIRIPAKSAINFSRKAQRYQTQFEFFIQDIIEDPLGLNELKNEFFINNLNAQGTLGALAEGTVSSDFTTRPEAIAASEQLLTLYDNLQDWQDSNLDNLETVDAPDAGNAYLALSKLITATTRYLIDISFDLPAEKIIILPNERNVIELCSELYNDPEKIDFFIQTNDLTADEIEVIPAGREVLYYE